ASLAGAGGPGAMPPPAFAAQALSAQAVRLSAFRGKVVFLNLWTTWCPPCRQEMPAMQQLAQKLAGDGFVMLAVSEDDEGAPVVKNFVDEMKLTFPVLVDSTGEVGRRFAITGYPATFRIDPEGRQVARFIGPRDWRDPAIERDVKTLVDTGRWVRGPDGPS